MSSSFSEDRLVQKTTAEYFEDTLEWESIYAYNSEKMGEGGTLGRNNEHEIVLTKFLLPKLRELNPDLPEKVYQEAVDQLTASNASKTLLNANRDLYDLIRDGVRVEYKADDGTRRTPRLKVIDFDNPDTNHFLVVREMWVKGINGSPYRKRPDIMGFVNGLPLLFIELKKSTKNVKTAYEKNLKDYLDTIPHLFFHNALCMLSNGIEARVGTMVSPYEYFHEWKRIDEDDAGVVHWQTMLKALCDKRRFLDVVESFIIFDDSPSSGTIKAMAANHQFMGVNKAFRAVQDRDVRKGRLGVFWHTQGSGKSYSMLCLSQKVHRKVAGSFTFVILTDRKELDDQIAKTFAGCGAVGEAKAVHASTGKHLKKLLQEDHRYIFTLVHKFNLDDDGPYTQRENVIVIADEAHRTQSGKLAENMRRVLPNASFIAFTGTPLMKSEDDQLTRQIFGEYVSTYDFRRAIEDKATVPLFYDNRGEKLDLATSNINDRIADELEKYDLDQDQEASLSRYLSKDYHILTADDRLDRIARDMTAHYSKRWETGKAMYVALDKVTCVRMHDLFVKYWDGEVKRQQKLVESMKAEGEDLKAKLKDEVDDTRVRVLAAQASRLDTEVRKLEWLDSTEACVVVSEEQNEVTRFKEWGIDIVPHRARMKSQDLAEEFKKPGSSFRVVFVCAMWLTGFDVPSLSTMYLDKPMKGHTLMQAIARANRKAKGKNNGHLVDYNGMLKSLRAALATYGGGNTGGAGGAEGPTKPMEELLKEFVEALTSCGDHLKECGFDLKDLVKAKGFDKLALLDKANENSAVNAVCRNDKTRVTFEVLAREVFKKRKALISEPQMIGPYRHKADGVDAIYKRLSENKDAADITKIMMALRGIISDSVVHEEGHRLPGEYSGKTFDISDIDFDKLSREFEGNSNKNTTVQSMKDAVEKKLKKMIKNNPLRTNFEERYREIIKEYNKETDRVTIEETFAQLIAFVDELSMEYQRAVQEGLSEDHLAVFDLLVQSKDELKTRSRNKVKEIATELLTAIKFELSKLDNWRETRQTQAQVKRMIHDHLYSDKTGLPVDDYTPEDVSTLADVIYLHVYENYVDFSWKSVSA